MKISEILQREVAAAHVAFPNANGDDLTALALSASALRKNLAERGDERDMYHRAFRAAAGPLAPNALARMAARK
jgi:hypothetical protein